MELKDYLGIMKRRFHIFAAVAILVMVAYFIMLFAEKEVFTAKASVILRLRQDLEDYATIRGSTYRSPWIMSISTRRAQLTSRNVALHAAMAITAGRQIDTPFNDFDAISKFMLEHNYISRIAPLVQAEFLTTKGKAELEPLARAIQSAVTISHPEERVLIVDVIARSTSQETAILYANAVAKAGEWLSEIEASADIYNAMAEERRDITGILLREDVVPLEMLKKLAMKAGLEIGPDESYHEISFKLLQSLDYNSGDVELLVDEIVRMKEEEMLALREKIDYLEPADCIKQMVKEISELEQQHRLAEEKVRKIDERIWSILRERVHRNVRYADISEIPGPLSERTSAIEEKLVQAKVRLAELQKRYTEHHPEIANTISLIDTLEKELRAEVERSAFADIQDLIHARSMTNVEALQLEQRKKEMMAKHRDVHELGRQYFRMQAIYDNIKRRTSAFIDDMNILRGMVPFEAGYIKFHEPATIENVISQPKRAAGAFWFFIIIALLAGTACSYFTEYLDTTIRTEYDVRRHSNIPVLAIIPQIKEEVLLTRAALRTPITETFTAIATLIYQKLKEENIRSLLITSTMPREGKTTVAINLAVAFANKHVRTILVDADLRIPQIHHKLAIDNSVGLSSLLRNFTTSDVISQQSPRFEEIRSLLERGMSDVKIPNLLILPGGPSVAESSILLQSPIMKHIKMLLDERSDLVIYDSPPLSTVSDALLLSSITDACILVVGAGFINRKQLAWTKHLLTQVQSNILGAVLNRSAFSGGFEYYYYDHRGRYVRQSL